MRHDQLGYLARDRGGQSCPAADRPTHTGGAVRARQCQQAIVPVSSGGLAAGVATAIKSINPAVRVIGVQPMRANAAYVSRYLDEIVLVDERDIALAHVAMKRRTKIIAEPAGAVDAAAFLSGQVNTAKRTVAIVSGGNLTPDTMTRLEEMAAGAGCLQRIRVPALRLRRLLLW